MDLVGKKIYYCPTNRHGGQKCSAGEKRCVAWKEAGKEGL